MDTKFSELEKSMENLDELFLLVKKIFDTDVRELIEELKKNLKKQIYLNINAEILQQVVGKYSKF